MLNIKDLDKEYVAATYARFPLTIVKGQGSLAYDEDGKEYIDMGSGIAVNTFGYSDKLWQDAVTEQLSKLQHTSNLYYTEPCALLAKELCERSGMKRVFFSNSGAESNECAIKAARKYASDKKGADCYKIITLVNSFHGRTITTLAATGQDVFHKDFTPLTDGFLYARANDISEILSLAKDNKIAAVMIELIQGEGGVMPLDKEYVRNLSAFCKENDILLITDEVQTGNGRTGELFAYQRYGIVPDIVTTAKGLGGGLPIGATILGEKVQNTYTPGLHGSTFGGNPVCCAGALNILSRIDKNLLSDVRDKSEFIFNSLCRAKGIKNISGMGLMIGIETEKDASDIVKSCMERGVLVLKAKNKVRLLPALNIPDDLLKKAITVIKEACAE